MVAAIAFKLDELRNYAAAAGLGLNFVVKEAFLFELMEIMDREGFVMKGGTALNKGFLSGHQRFSEDLDYDTDYTEAETKKYVRSLGWKIKKEFFTRNSIGFSLGYKFENIIDSVRLDVSFGVKGRTEERRLTSDFLPVSKKSLIYNLKELVLQKERAFEERLEWKDLYDLYWIRVTHASEFRIKRRQQFINALSSMKVPKTANAYIPVQKRPNWDAVIDELKQEINL